MDKPLNNILNTVLIAALFFYCISAYASTDTLSLFPIEKYDQKITDWVSPADPSYTKALLTPEQQTLRQAELYRHYFGKESPWNADYIHLLFSQKAPDDLFSLETSKVLSLTNQNQPANKIGYGSNFRPYSDQWFAQIKNNIHLQQFVGQKYDSMNRAIAITNIQSRELPTEEPHFYSYKLAGEGYPFDNAQAVVIWAGTPLYVLGETTDRLWSFVLTPSFIGWVKNTEIAKADARFVSEWIKVSRQHLAAITNTRIAIVDIENNIPRFPGYIGMLFPGIKTPKGIQILIPVMDQKQQAHIHHAEPSIQDIALVPMLPTPQHFSTLMQKLLGRTYGWGGMYFYNDCSSELKNIYSVFGIWLPIHSTNQVDPQQVLGKAEDLSSSEPDGNMRSAYLMAHGHPWMTIIHVGGHVLDYLGSYPNPDDPTHRLAPLSYQAMWGFGAVTGVARRAVVGQSVILPLLTSYPEDPELRSHLSKTTFQLLYLDELPSGTTLAEVVGMMKVNLKTLLSP